jgi:hypothetical protein
MNSITALRLHIKGGHRTSADLDRLSFAIGRTLSAHDIREFVNGGTVPSPVSLDALAGATRFPASYNQDLRHGEWA